MKKFDARILTHVSLILSLGFILKLLTDVVTRSFLSFLFIDFLLLSAIFILFRYTYFRIAIVVAIMQTVLSALFFPTTDIWFLRPFSVLAVFAALYVIQKRPWKEKTRFLASFLLGTKASMLAISLSLLVLFTISPTLIGFDTLENTFFETLEEQGLPEDQVILLENYYPLLIMASLVIVGLVYAYIPATVHLFIALALYERVYRRFSKEKIQ